MSLLTQIDKLWSKMHNGINIEIVKGRDNTVWRLSSNGFWNNIGCLLLAFTFVIEVSRLWEKEEEQRIIGEKRKRCSIRLKFELYEVFV